MTRTGRLQYTGRAFAMDADQAMGSDIVRALIELITNADDAYGDRTGEIVVTVDQRGDQALVMVTDTAIGLTPEGLEAAFGELGGRTSGFHEGADVRGQFGRGAKDTAAFGRTVFESIRDGRYGRFEIRRDLTWEADEAPATSEHHAELGIPAGGVGLRASVVVERNEKVAIPTHRVLAERLRDHVQLRDLNRRQVVILRRFPRQGPIKSDVVRWNPPDGELLHDGEIGIPAHGVVAHLRLWQLSRPADTSPDAYSTHGVVIRGRRAAYQNTMFGQTAPETARIRGELDCPHIDELIRSYDQDQNDENNPSPIVRRDRAGLDPEHPFMVALAAAVLDVLLPLIEGMRVEKESALGGAELRDGLDRAARALAALLRTDLDDLEEDGPGGLVPDSASPLLVIPPRLLVRRGTVRAISVVIDEAVLESSEFEVESADADVAAIVDVTDAQPYADRAAATIRTVRVSGVGEGDTVVGIRHRSGRVATCSVTVHDRPPVPLEAPVDLEWASDSVSATRGRPRTIGLRAPLELGEAGLLRVAVAATDDRCVTLPETEAVLRLTGDGWLEGRCHIRPAAVGTTSIVATAEGRTSTTRVMVKEPTGLGGLGTRVTIVDEQRGRLRGIVASEDDGFVISLFKRHPGLNQLLGRRLEDGSFARESEADARTGIAEAVASVVADWLVGKEAARYPHLFTDAAAVIDARNRQIYRYLPAVRTAMEAP